MADSKAVVGKVAAYVAEFAVSRLPKVAPALSSTMIRLMDLAIDGFGKFPGAKQTAGKTLARRQDIQLAVDSVIRSHTAMAAGQGVVANLGGIVSAIIGTPVNITGIVTVQIRMVACIAHLHGYDVDDPRVRTAMAMCLLGDRELERQIMDGRLPTTPLAVATSPVYDPTLHTTVAERVLSNILSEAAGKGLVTAIGRKAPIIGGGVGGAADGLDTYLVSRCARKNLIPRRMMTTTQPYVLYSA